MDILTPTDRAEVVAVFRYGLIARIGLRALEHGELAEELRDISKERVRPPDSDRTRSYSVPTLERWLAAYRKNGIEGLKPRPRKDKGRGRDLGPELRKLLCDIRTEFPSASVSLILRTLRTDGRLDKSIKAGTIRRFFREQGLDKIAVRDGKGQKTRLKWEAARPDALWHGDVCHGPTLTIAGKKTPVRIHALLDDASRYIVAFAVESDEKEDTMLELLVRALRRWGKPDALYLDNGSTYRGDALRLCCARLQISLIHARPYDPEARGKMERFWRTLRGSVLDHLGAITSLDDIRQRMQAFLDKHYHAGPHAGLMGRAPLCVYAPEGREVDDLSEARLREALTVRAQRRVRRDTTISVRGRLYELDHGYLAGKVVTIAHCLLDDPPAPVVEHEGKRLPLLPVDPVHNAHRKRPPRKPRPDSASAQVDFDPGAALLRDMEDEEVVEDDQEDLDALF